MSALGSKSARQPRRPPAQKPCPKRKAPRGEPAGLRKARGTEQASCAIAAKSRPQMPTVYFVIELSQVRSSTTAPANQPRLALQSLTRTSQMIPHSPGPRPDNRSPTGAFSFVQLQRKTPAVWSARQSRYTQSVQFGHFQGLTHLPRDAHAQPRTCAQITPPLPDTSRVRFGTNRFSSSTRLLINSGERI